MKKIIVFILLILMIGGAIGFYQFNKKVESLENTAADYSLSSDDLFDAFDQDESNAQAKFAGKVIEVKGEVLRMNQNDSTQSLSLKAVNSMMGGGVNCSFPKPIEGVNIGDVVRVKCECQGYLMDVVLNNCVLIK